MKRSYLWVIILLIFVGGCVYAFKDKFFTIINSSSLGGDETVNSDGGLGDDNSQGINILSNIFNNDDPKINYNEVDLHSDDLEFWENAVEATYYHYSIGDDSFDNHRSDIEIVAHWVEYNGGDIKYNISFIFNDRNYHASLDKDLNVTGLGSGGGGILQEAVAIKDLGEDILYTWVYTDYKNEYKGEKLGVSIVYLQFDQSGKTNKYSYVFEDFSDEILEKSNDSFIDEETAISIVSKDSGVKADIIRDADSDTWFLGIMNGLYTQDKVYKYQFTDDKGYTYIYELSAYDGSITSKNKYKDIGDAKALDIALKDAGIKEDDLRKPSGDMAFYLSPHINKVTEGDDVIYEIGINISDDSYYLYKISAESGKIIRKTISKNYIISSKSGKEYEVYPYNDEKTKITIDINDLGIDDIYDYKDLIYLRLEFDGDKAVDRQLLDIEEEDRLGKLSAEELFEEYYFDKKYEHLDAGHINKDDKIILSELKEGVIYDYDVEGYCDVHIVDDLDVDIIVFYKETGSYRRGSNSNRYNKRLYLKNELYGGYGRGCGGRSDGYTYSILYKTASTEDIMKVVRPYEVYYISSGGNYNVGDEIDRDYDMDYIYNDTENNIRLKFYNDVHYRNYLDEGTILTLHPDERAYANSVTKLTVVGEDVVEGKIPSKPITKEIAKKYINGEIDDYEMRKYKSIDVEGARMLAQYYTGDDPELGGLETLSVEAAVELAKFKGDYFRFDSLKSISAEAAEEIAKFKGPYMSFDGLEDLDAGVAAGLAKYKGSLAPDATYEYTKTWGPILSLDGLKTISVEAATELAKSKSSHLSLEGLTDIDVKAAEALSHYSGYYLFFRSLNKLTPEIVEAFDGRDYLYLEGFQSIDVETAFSLSKFNGNKIHLGITEITPEVAKALARFKGEELSLDSLTSLDKDSARYLSRYRGKLLRLMSLKKIDDDVAEELATYKGQLDVNSYYGIGEKIEAMKAE